MATAKTSLDLRGEQLIINHRPTYAEIDGSPLQGRLMNARFIQGVFDDRTGRSRYGRFGRERFDPDEHTDALIAALPQWYGFGLRGFTVGWQGGGPCFTIANDTIDNNPFGEDGLQLDTAYAARMDRLIRAADALGMIVIVSFLYGAQAERLTGDAAVRDAVATAARFLRDGGYGNVIVEVANEHNIGAFASHPIVHTVSGMLELIALARDESGGLPVGCSGGGGYLDRDLAAASDVVLVHGNGCSRQRLYELVRRARQFAPGRPVVCNEDSPAIGNLDASIEAGGSWGYYNNATKQEPPADWRVLPGEDTYFAWRMAEAIGIELDQPPPEPLYLAGFEPHTGFEGQRWIRVASRYPERIDRVEFWRNGKRWYVAYDEPYAVNQQSNWRWGAVTDTAADRQWRAVVHLADGEVVELTWNNSK